MVNTATKSKPKTKAKQVLDKTAEPCLVCSAPTSTLHLQVNACYACSAFFRRSVGVHKSYRCQRNDGNCDLSIKKPGKPLCRYCRYHKCVKVGMQLAKPKEESPCDDDGFIRCHKLPENRLNCEDFDKIFEKILHIFEKPTSESMVSSDFNSLLATFMESIKPAQKLVPIHSDETRIDFIEKFYIKTAEMLALYKPFLELPLKDKILLHKQFWQPFYHLERYYQACQVFGLDPEDGRVPLDQSQYVDSAQTEKHFAHTIHTHGAVLFLIPLIDKIKLMGRFFKKANFTFEEFAHLINVTLWSPYEITSINPATLQLGQKIIDQLSTDLHNYYISELRMPFYASRQALIYRTIHFMGVIVFEKNQMLKAREIFSFGKDEFPYCRFEINYNEFINKCTV